MRAMTLQQPYASAIAIGPKRIENRTWRRSLPAGGEWLGLHAGTTLYDDGAEVDVGTDRAERLRALMIANGWADCPPVMTLPRGVMLGAMHVSRIVRYDANSNLRFFDFPFERSGRVETDPWAFGPWCWVVDEVRLLPEPIAYRGLQGLWPVREPLASVLRALAEVSR